MAATTSLPFFEEGSELGLVTGNATKFVISDGFDKGSGIFWESIVSGDGGWQCVSQPLSAITFLLILTSIFGIVGNILVIYIIIVLREYKKTITNLYLVQLAISDFIFMIALPIEVDGMLRGDFIYGIFICKVYQSIRLISYYSSIFFLTVMSIDRYLAVNHAMKSWATKLRQKKSVYITSAAVWALSVFAVVPIFIRSDVKVCKCSTDFSDKSEADDIGNSGDTFYVKELEIYEDDIRNDEIYFNEMQKNAILCSYADQPSMIGSVIANFIGAFVIPLIIIIGCYVNILAKVSTQTTLKSSKSAEARRRVTRMVVLLVTTFIICWLPYHIYNLSCINGIDISWEGCVIAKQIVCIVAYSNSVLNPILYTFLGTNIRHRWKETLARTRSFRPSFGSRTDYNVSKHKRKPSSQTGDGQSQGSLSRVPRSQTGFTKINQTEIQ